MDRMLLFYSLTVITVGDKWKSPVVSRRWRELHLWKMWNRDERFSCPVVQRGSVLEKVGRIGG